MFKNSRFCLDFVSVLRTRAIANFAAGTPVEWQNWIGLILRPAVASYQRKSVYELMEAYISLHERATLLSGSHVSDYSQRDRGNAISIP